MARAAAETVYLVDVRTREEYAAGHIPGFAWFPGGQAVQRADDTVAVKTGIVIFCCDGTARAAVTASWYRQMGFPNVYAVAGGTTAWTAAGKSLAAGTDEPVEPLVAAARERVRQVAPSALAALLASSRPPAVLNVETSDRFAAGHVPGARWLSRSWLELRLAELAADKNAPLVVTDEDGHDAVLAAATIEELGYKDVAALAGGMEAWRKEGRPVEQGLTGDAPARRRRARRSRPRLCRHDQLPSLGGEAGPQVRARAMIRAHLLRWRPRQPAQRTESTPRRLPSGAASQLDPSHRSSWVSPIGS
jgi:rhodanese-related sulfurtransferase